MHRLTDMRAPLLSRPMARRWALRHRLRGVFVRRIGEFADDRRGVAAFYVVLLLTLIMGSGVLAIDVGRMVVLRTQLQNAADSAALAGASQLDGTSGARQRATTLASASAARATSLFAEDGTFAVQSIGFLKSFNPSEEATGDSDASIIQLTMRPESISFVFQPILQYMSGIGASGASGAAAGADAPDKADLLASATAQSSPVICNAPPLMVCNPAESGGESKSLSNPINAGKQIVLKEGPGGNAGAPGQFGLLCTADGNCGANDIGSSLAALEQAKCHGPDVTTAPGSKTQQIREGFNSRFGSAKNDNYPARNVIAYPRDSAHQAGNSDTFMGDGYWDEAAYWNEAHSGQSLPYNLNGASRYQVYLYELGETFARSGKKTLYPVPNDLPYGYTVVNSYGENIPDDGRPPSKYYPVQDPRRRVVKAAILDCVALDVRGSGTYPTFGRYVDVFVTEQVPKPPEATAYGEIISAVTETTSEDFHANVRLLQ